MPSSKTSVDKRDVYYRKGKSEGYRARSAYKLLHLDEEFDLFTGVHTAVDLCAAPGSWSQVLAQKLRPGKGNGDAKVVSLDLQAMAPLKDITILQTDITLPSTIALVLNALGGRKADLVVCDGAPDVTGVHDLDAYLHSQLLLAALTLSLTLLSPKATLIFKIFLSPLDPKADLLRSQLRIFFPGPSPGERNDLGDANVYKEFEDSVEEEMYPYDEDARVERGHDRLRSGEGFDLEGRRGGVWVRKPRSSRAGSGEAFIVCRNFDPSKVPLPPSFSTQSLTDLAKQTTGTLTLESLAYLNRDGPPPSEDSMREWSRIKAFVESGSLDAPTLSKPRDLHVQIEGIKPAATQRSVRESPIEIETRPIETPSQIVISAAGPSKFPNPSENVNQNQSTSRQAPPSQLHLSPNPRHNPAIRRAAAWAAANAGSSSQPTERQHSTDSLSPPSSASPTSTFYSGTDHRPWDRSAGPPSPLPSPICLPNENDRSGTDGFPDFIPPSLGDGGAISPALSTSSRTELFFATSHQDSLPVPPKPLPHAESYGLGRGLPGSLKSPERSVTSPHPSPSPGMSLPATKSNSLFALPSIPTSSRPFTLSDIPRGANRSVSSPIDKLAIENNGKSIFSLPAIPPHPSSPDSALPSTSTSTRTAIPSSSNLSHTRRESKTILREHRKSYDTTLHPGDMLSAEAEGLDEYDVKSTDKTCWRLEKILGEGAFSAVWTAVEVLPTFSSSEQSTSSSSSQRSIARVAAIKTMDKKLCARNSRTRISFVREVEVLKHISHPSIVSYLSSFSTATHHCLVLEHLSGGELFELISDEKNRSRMLLSCPGDRQDEVKDPDGYGFVRRIFGELCRAVGWLHEVGVVHRDIKLENLLLTVYPFTLPSTSSNSIPLHLLPKPPRPLLKLTDFGLSRFISPEEPLLHTRCGSESFAAPEIIMGRPYDGRQTDAWAVGVVLYALVAGELPFDEGSPIAEKEEMSRSRSGSVGSRGYNERDERRRTMMRIAKGEYLWREGVAENEELRQVVASLLVRDPKKRSTISQVWDLDWMIGPGGVERPVHSQSEGNSPGMTPGVEGEMTMSGSNVVGTGHVVHGNGNGIGNGTSGRKRRILDGFLVDGEMISEVAMAES